MENVQLVRLYNSHERNKLRDNDFPEMKEFGLPLWGCFEENLNCSVRLFSAWPSPLSSLQTTSFSIYYQPSSAPGSCWKLNLILFSNVQITSIVLLFLLTLATTSSAFLSSFLSSSEASRTVWRALNPWVRCAFDNVCFQFPQIHMQPSWHHFLPIPTENHHLYSVLIWVLSKNEDFIIGRIWNLEEPIHELWKTR